MKTLNGYLVRDLSAILDQPLPPQAYKALPGAAGLTDIDAGWQRRAFNKIFGVYGIGWGFDFQRSDIDLRHEEVQTKNGSKIAPFARVYGQFWFAYVDDEGQSLRASFPVTGANSNQTGNEGYTLKGAITNAIGFGASMIGWQESVYLGARSHNNTEGFADGKSWHEVEPVEDVPSEVVPVSAPTGSVGPIEPPVVLEAGYCKDCLLVIEAVALPAVCKCGGRDIIAATSVDTAESSAAKLAEIRSKKAAPTAKPVSSPTPTEDDKSLAEKLGFESIKHAVCTQCGYAEPVNALPEACPKCGVADPWSVAPSHKAMVDMSANIKAKLDIEKSAADSKTVLDEIKAVCKNDRRLILSSLTAAAGKPVKNYSECDLDTMRRCLAQLKTGNQWVGDDNESASETEPTGKSELCKAIYGLARGLNIGTPGQVIAEIGKVAGKPISTAAQLNETELLDVYRNFKERSV